MITVLFDYYDAFAKIAYSLEVHGVESIMMFYDFFIEKHFIYWYCMPFTCSYSEMCKVMS